MVKVTGNGRIRYINNVSLSHRQKTHIVLNNGSSILATAFEGERVLEIVFYNAIKPVLAAANGYHTYR